MTRPYCCIDQAVLFSLGACVSEARLWILVTKARLTNALT
jgi:hypothetical protein